MCCVAFGSDGVGWDKRCVLVSPSRTVTSIVRGRDWKIELVTVTKYLLASEVDLGQILFAFE